MSYDPHEVVKDGPFRAPRVWQHILKVLTSAALYAAVLSIFHFSPLLSAIIAGPFLIVCIQVREAFWPTDPNSATRALSLKLADVLTDTSLASSSFALALCADGQYAIAAALLVILFAIYMSFRRNARP